MMQDCAMQILELIMNSIHANSSFIEVYIKDSYLENKYQFKVQDNGKGMSQETLEHVTSPFQTSRTTRKVGLGVAFMKGLTEQCNGSFTITSKEKVGTTIIATVQRNHWDTPAIGDLGEMMMCSIQANEKIDFYFVYETDTQKFVFESKEVKEKIEGVSILEPDILLWIREYINQGIQLAKENRL
ncbi:ATP-binding protein [Anaerorhabdus sp.]|uniref:ATP-binding protein n=1 Tax=Anaerorhabdus sp. TaxID=1872524 RepID=UPI002FC5D6AE